MPTHFTGKFMVNYIQGNYHKQTHIIHKKKLKKKFTKLKLTKESYS